MSYHDEDGKWESVPWLSTIKWIVIAIGAYVLLGWLLVRWWLS